MPTLKVDARAQFLLASFFGLIGVFALQAAVMSSLLTAGLAVGVAAYVVACGAAFFAFKHSYTFPSLGFGNAVTLVRLVCVCVLASALIDGSDRQWMLVGLAIAAFLSDGVDGWLARRQGYASAFGARFDVEVDSAFALVLALLGFFVAEAPVYVLALGLPRYLFSAAVFAVPWLGADLPERFSRKVVCVVQIGVLIAVLIPGLSSLVQSSVIALAAFALAWSFAMDVSWLRRNRS